MSDARTRIAGVDEAGLGPILGPLAIGYSVLELPAPDADPWKLLRRVVAKRVVKNPRRLVVADSKKVFARSERGLQRLERTALGFLALLDPDGRAPASAEALLFGELAPPRELVRRHPWYERLPALPVASDAGGIELVAARLGRELRQQRLELLDAGVRIVPAGELNDSYAETKNKSLTVWEKTREILAYLWDWHAREGLDVCVDILGGRIHYGPLLARGLPSASVLQLEESEGLSAYRLDERGGPRRMRVEFRARGEDHSFCVALSSCLAKYARELVMEAFNAHFAALQADLRPTAGYFTDGRRWLEDASPALDRAPVDRRCLVRER